MIDLCDEEVEHLSEKDLSVSLIFFYSDFRCTLVCILMRKNVVRSGKWKVCLEPLHLNLVLYT